MLQILWPTDHQLFMRLETIYNFWLFCFFLLLDRQLHVQRLHFFLLPLPIF
jgi:hypothetical protein